MCRGSLRTKFAGCSARKAFSNVELEGVRKMCVFQYKKLAISRKRWEIEPRLLLITNRKWHTPFHMTRKSSTFRWLWRSVLQQELYRQYSASFLATNELSCFALIQVRRVSPVLLARTAHLAHLVTRARLEISAHLECPEHQDNEGIPELPDCRATPDRLEMSEDLVIQAQLADKVPFVNFL